MESTNKICNFCEIVAGRYKYCGIDEPFISSNDFVAIASIGALVEGWSLVIPRQHQVSLRNCYANNLFSAFVDSVIFKLLTKYGSLIAFEHGANEEGSITSCGTDHAHLHLVPSEKSLLPEIKEYSLNWIECDASDIYWLSEGREYLYYVDIADTKSWSKQKGYIHILQHPISQFFRKIIAAREGVLEKSDYKTFPHLNIARQTRQVLLRSIA